MEEVRWLHLRFALAREAGKPEGCPRGLNTGPVAGHAEFESAVMPEPTSVPAEDALRLPAPTVAPDFGPEIAPAGVLVRLVGAVVQASPDEWLG